MTKKKRQKAKKPDPETEYQQLALEKLRLEIDQNRTAYWLSHKNKAQADSWIV